MQLAGIGIFLVLWTAGSAAMGAAWSYAGKAGVAVGVIWLLSRRALNRGEANHGRSAVGLMGLLVFGFPLMLTWLAEFGLRQASVVVVGAHATAVDAGILRAALIVSLVGEMPLTALSQLFSPMIASLHAQGARERLGKLYGTAARWSLTGALPLMLFAGAQREGVLGVFGQEYRAGAAVLLLLCLGRAFSASTGSVGWLLIMSGRPWVNLTLNAVFATINISLCWVLLPRHGVVAAAAAISGAMVGVNLARLCAVWTLMRVQPYSLATLKPIIVSVALSVPLWIWPITGTLWLVLAGAAYVSASIAACAAFGLQDDDRLVLDAVRRRLNRQRGKDV